MCIQVLLNTHKIVHELLRYHEEFLKFLKLFSICERHKRFVQFLVNLQRTMKKFLKNIAENFT